MKNIDPKSRAELKSVLRKLAGKTKTKGKSKKKKLGKSPKRWQAGKWSVSKMYAKTDLDIGDVLEIRLNSFAFSTTRPCVQSQRLVVGMSIHFDKEADRLRYTIFTLHRESPRFEYDAFVASAHGEIYV